MIASEYAAGFFDGEGTVQVECVGAGRIQNGVVRKSHAYRVRVKISNTNKEILDLLSAQWGGTVRPMIRKHENHRQAWVWNMWARDVAAFLKEIFPYLVVKRNAVRYAIRLQRVLTLGPTRGSYRYNRVSEREERLRRKLFLKVRECNVRGAKPFLVPKCWQETEVAA